jgi:hypothetical protein
VVWAVAPGWRDVSLRRKWMQRYSLY